MLRPVLVTPPSGAIITLADAKQHLRVDYSDDDTLVQEFIDAAVAHLDGYSGRLGRPLLSQTWSQSFADFSASPWRLRFADFISVTSITYFDAANTTKTLSPTIYSVLTDEIGPYINLVSGNSYPNVFSRDDAVTVTWVCGYANIPADIKVALKMMVAHWYENRGVIVTEKRLESIPMAVDALLVKYSRVAV